MMLWTQCAPLRRNLFHLMEKVLKAHVREHLGAAVPMAKERAANIEPILSALRSFLKEVPVTPGLQMAYRGRIPTHINGRKRLAPASNWILDSQN